MGSVPAAMYHDPASNPLGLGTTIAWSRDTYLRPGNHGKVNHTVASTAQLRAIEPVWPSEQNKLSEEMPFLKALLRPLFVLFCCAPPVDDQVGSWAASPVSPILTSPIAPSLTAHGGVQSPNFAPSADAE